MVSSGLAGNTVQNKLSSEGEKKFNDYFTQLSLNFFVHDRKIFPDTNHIIKDGLRIRRFPSDVM